MSRAIIEVDNLTGGYDEVPVLKNVSMDVYSGEVLVIAGKSGCGKSTIMRYLIGLQKPDGGRILFDRQDIWESAEILAAARRRWGVLFQSGALLGNLTVLENVILPMSEFTDLTRHEMTDVAMSKLEMVGMLHAAYDNPLEISGGMQKRAALARAMALDPEVLFFDEPSAGLDPVTSAELDKTILSVNRNQGTTLIIVTHELESIHAISDRVVMLDPEEKGIIATGSAGDLAANSTDPRVIDFFRRKTGD
ncbi:polyamine ABC transporter ATP-binding protein [Candidatus Fermentibacteria bacterium]|nr:MAG: polyamine ABC transporter ATP-binding protein [Candidatus Fermentibacteria bacterium]